jgi:hypothetical protein
MYVCIYVHIYVYICIYTDAAGQHKAAASASVFALLHTYLTDVPGLMWGGMGGSGGGAASVFVLLY